MAGTQRLRSLVAAYPVTAFIAITYVVQVLLVSSQFYEIRNYGLGIFRVYAPALVALGVSYLAFGKSEAWKLITSLGAWRVAPKYYAFALLYPPVVALGSLGILRLIGLNHSIELDVVEIAKLSFFRLSISISLVEEIAWVGFLLAMFSRRWRLYAACLAVGFFWAVWYIPLILADIQVAPGLPILPLIINFMTIGAICGWLYYRTRSALLVMLMQIATNYTSQIIPVLPLRGGVTQYVAFVILKSLFALALFLLWGPKPLFGPVAPGKTSLEPAAESP